ncbi:MAG: 30S ribosomal protein S4 [Deltaproteobacteria bacterium]|nr:30S ribosomal protein S4 [Candidatus Anaeroferrophillus wilburensis]MBN2889547.1 30S ribosomal protein S4 [Deltaproteobacteria bacterium]
MARYRESVCRLCRREGVKLFLKGDRCYTDKCAVDRRAYAPGQHGQRRSKFSEYGVQLREKQKVRRIYGLLEKQFRRYFQQADRQKGVTGENLLILVERRLDNIVYRLGFTNTRSEARQLVRHGHFLVNGRQVDIPSFQVKVGDVIELREKSRKVGRIVEALEAAGRRGLPAFLDLDKDNFKGTVNALPKRDDIAQAINEQLIVEFYSR